MHAMTKILHLLFFFFSFWATTVAQQDTILLSTDALSVEDLKADEDAFLNQKVVSASRSLQDLKDLPFTIYVITKEEIQAKGYNTLVDALKWVPGIRVSQPGSGLEGETFIMRGLQGNTYAKILVNDIPLKSYATRGMPIGAQLPIREAERIEVIFGPAAAVYGADASAGVINIVTKQSDRPLYTQAEISLGADAFSSLHVLFGGKLGQGDKILKYSVFGSNTSFNNRQIFSDQELLFNASRYDPDSTYLNNPNYSSDFNPTPHLSRMVGINLEYKDLNFSTLLMSRQDHSALGLNPTAVSYENPNNYIRDNIVNGRFGWSPTWNNWGLKFNLDLLFYKKDGTSSTQYVESNLKNLFDFYIRNTFTDPDVIMAKREEVHQAHFSGNRYSETDSFEPNAELLLFFTPIKEIELLFGFRSRYVGAESYDYQRQVFFGGLSVGDSDYSFFSNAAFVQTYLNFEKIKGVASLSYSGSRQYATRFNPRIALLYPINAKLGLRAFYGTSFRVPSAFYYTNSFTVGVEALPNYTSGNPIGPSDLEPEENTTIEVGLRYSYKKIFSIDADFYYSKTDNIIAFQDFVPGFNPFESDSNFVYTTGYTNFGDSRLNVYGVQSNIATQIPLKNRDVEVKLGLNFTFGEKHIPGPFQFILSDVPEQPNFSLQVQLAVPIGEKWTVYLDNLYHTSSTSETAVLEITDIGMFDRATYVIPEYYTLDILTRYNISKNFSAYFQVLNVFNKKYGGLSATGTPDDLFYNAQSAQLGRFGISYRLD